MKRIEQRNAKEGDCGIACIAMITGKPYEEIELSFRKNDLIAEDGTMYTFHKDLIIILEQFGYSVKRKRFTKWSNVQTPAIVKINPRTNNRWHWVVYSHERTILDPKPGAPEVIVDVRGKKGVGQYLQISKSC